MLRSYNDEMHIWMKYFPKLIFAGSLFYAIIVYLIILITIPSSLTQMMRLEQMYALTAFMLLYLVIISKPIESLWKHHGIVQLFIMQRKYVLLIAMVFAFIHAGIAFFGQLGGFSGLFFLSFTYLLGILLSFTALVFLFFLLLTLYRKNIPDVIKERVERVLYVIGVLVLVHALMLGSHFSDLSKILPQVFIAGVIIYVLLEAARIDQWLKKRLKTIHFGLVFCLTLVGIIWFYFSMFQNKDVISFGIHGDHLRAGSNPQVTEEKRYTVDFDYPDIVLPDTEIPLTFSVFHANTGEIIKKFDIVSEKLMHVIVVNEALTYFDHIHPEFRSGKFFVTTTFPESGTYRIYTDFQPTNGSEQIMAFSLSTTDTDSDRDTANGKEQEVAISREKKFGNYQVAITYPTPLSAAALTRGETEISFTISDASGNPVTTLQPYLGSFGHMVMINKKTFEYLHVHPSVGVSNATNIGGPKVAFYPVSIYGTVQPGIYRVFAQFNPNGELITTDFTLQVE